MTTETLSITHVRILIDADARIAFVSVREFDDAYGGWNDDDCTYTSADYHGADWLEEARFIARDLASQWCVRTIVEAHA
jgi:hypothetical protein